jgi:hypothetical protein
MAFASSYVNGRTLSDILQGTSINLDTNTIKVALFTNSVTAGDKNAVESYGSAPYNANEVSSANYTAGGAALTNPGIATPSGGKFVFDDTADSLAWSDVTFTARGCVVYSDTASPKRVLCAINFGSDRSVTAGTFTITWDATNGIFYATY